MDIGTQREPEATANKKQVSSFQVYLLYIKKTITIKSDWPPGS